MKPREKLQRFGVETLTNEELFSLLLGSGTRHHSATTIAKILAKKLPLQPLTLTQLLQTPGIGPAKASALLAAIEMVERLRPTSSSIIHGVIDVLSWVSHIRHQPREHLLCLYLNARNAVLHQEIIAIGQLNHVHVAPRDIFLPIRSHPVCRIILAHNHPSDDPEPSLDDLQFTRRIEAAGQLLEVELLDHIIISPSNHYSLRAAGILGEPPTPLPASLDGSAPHQSVIHYDGYGLDRSGSEKNAPSL